MSSRRAGTTGVFLDLGDPDFAPLERTRYGFAVICAAITDMRACQDDPNGSRRVNVTNTLEVLRRLADRGTRSVFLSSSQVFDGETASPDEEAPTCPKNQYGAQKVAVEEAIAAEKLPVAVLRITKVLAERPVGVFKGWFDTLRQGCRCKSHIFGVGLDSSEKGNPPSKFARVYAQAREESFVPVAHAGEEGPANYVCEALDILKVRRIDHGNHALDDPTLVARIVRERIPMTVCPLSNKRLQVCPDLRRHPLRRMLEAGLVVNVNSDDPSYFGGYVNENFIAVQEALLLTPAEITTLARNSFVASFLTDGEKAAPIDRIGGPLGQPGNWCSTMSRWPQQPVAFDRLHAVLDVVEPL